MKTSLMTAVLVLVLPASSVFGARVTVEEIDPNVNGSGFYASIDNGPKFITFCLERSEGLIFGKDYRFTTGAAAIQGGEGAINGKDMLSDGSAALYLALLGGTPGVANLSTVTLQFAFWVLEEEKSLDDWSANDALAWVLGAFGTKELAMTDYDPSQSRVRVLNPFIIWDDGTTGYRQSLIALAVPDASASIVLLGLGLAALAGIRRFA